MRRLIILVLLLSTFIAKAQEGTLVVLNKSDHTVDLIDLQTQKSKATIPTGIGPHEVAISPDHKTAVITNYGDRSEPGKSLTVIDIANKKVVKTILLEYKAPHGIEFINTGNVLVTCEGSKKLIQVNINLGRVMKTIDTSQETSHMVAYSPKMNRAFVANIRSNSVSVIDLDKNKLDSILKTGKGAEGVALSADGNEVWITNRSNDNVSIIDVKTLETKKEIVSTKFPIRVKTTTDGKYALVSNAQTGDVNVFDAKTKQLLKTISMNITVEEKEASRLFQDFDKSPVPVGILIHPNNKIAFVANTNADIITIIDLTTMEVSGRLTAGKEPDGLGYSNIKL
ncbi:YncE family protein [Spongiivirga citrea]|uniref:Beta-propeller fold lactonase family protein n=1 Tax=Spongiivirga citrea TaxID=1481457 RepID=A0A6M0CIA5_9FLAO|nr:beta-propeller fold lactonase family protein [Spongiivirga citrea]NER17698.1 beta-propeller fold lactonase family protein [Spongiivirga citrea]